MGMTWCWNQLHSGGSFEASCSKNHSRPYHPSGNRSLRGVDWRIYWALGECQRLGKGKSPLVKNFCTNCPEAPLFPAHRATPAPNDDSEEWSTDKSNRSAFRCLGAHIPVELHRDHGVSKGIAFFDTEPQFPCLALFLDYCCALLLKSGESQKEFRRIGIGYFWRTKNIDLLSGPGKDEYGHAMIKIV